VWFLPLVMFLCRAREPTPLETAVALGAAALTIALALRETLGGAGSVRSDSAARRGRGEGGVTGSVTSVEGVGSVESDPEHAKIVGLVRERPGR
jgi:hypothetical protein